MAAYKQAMLHAGLAVVRGAPVLVIHRWGRGDVVY